MSPSLSGLKTSAGRQRIRLKTSMAVKASTLQAASCDAASEARLLFPRGTEPVRRIRGADENLDHQEVVHVFHA